MTLILGLTGSIATGKSSAARVFQEKGFPVISADEGARRLVEPPSPALDKIRTIFGEEFLFENGRLNREKLAALIFRHEKARKQLDQLMQPLLRQWLIKERTLAKVNQPPLVVMDIPLLYEKNLQDLVDQVMVVYTRETFQLERLMARDHLARKEALERIFSQINIERKVEWADIVIDNNEDEAYLRRQIEAWILFNGYEDWPE